MATNRTEPTVESSSENQQESEVLVLLQATGERLSALGRTIEQLEDRISVGLDDTHPTPETVGEVFQSGCRSPLGRELDYNVNRLRQLEQRLQGIIYNTLL